jgi:hypothetical protein
MFYWRIVNLKNYKTGEFGEFGELRIENRELKFGNEN